MGLFTEGLEQYNKADTDQADSQQLPNGHQDDWKQAKYLRRHIFQPSSDEISGEMGKLQRSWKNIVVQLNWQKLVDSSRQVDKRPQDKLKLDIGDGWDSEQGEEFELNFDADDEVKNGLSVCCRSTRPNGPNTSGRIEVDEQKGRIMCYAIYRWVCGLYTVYQSCFNCYRTVMTYPWGALQIRDPTEESQSVTMSWTTYHYSHCWWLQYVTKCGRASMTTYFVIELNCRCVEWGHVPKLWYEAGRRFPFEAFKGSGQTIHVCVFVSVIFILTEVMHIYLGGPTT